jgi:hypothetical protein
VPRGGLGARWCRVESNGSGGGRKRNGAERNGGRKAVRGVSRLHEAATDIHSLRYGGMLKQPQVVLRVDGVIFPSPAPGPTPSPPRAYVHEALSHSFLTPYSLSSSPSQQAVRFLSPRRAATPFTSLQRPVRLAYQPPAGSTFLLEQTSYRQPANSTFLSEQISTSHQQLAKRTGCTAGEPPRGPYAAVSAETIPTPPPSLSTQPPARSPPRPTTPTRPRGGLRLPCSLRQCGINVTGLGRSRRARYGKVFRGGIIRNTRDAGATAVSAVSDVHRRQALRGREGLPSRMDRGYNGAISA